MSTALGRSTRRLPGRGTAAKTSLVLAYVALAWLFGGKAGLAIGGAVVVARWAFGLPARFLWIGSLAALVAAPIATIVQGLPGSSVVGPEFGEHHLAAHVLVAVSLALAAFAGLLDLDRTRWRPPRRHPVRTSIAALGGNRNGEPGPEPEPGAGPAWAPRWGSAGSTMRTEGAGPEWAPRWGSLGARAAAAIPASSDASGTATPGGGEPLPGQQVMPEPIAPAETPSEERDQAPLPGLAETADGRAGTDAAEQAQGVDPPPAPSPRPGASHRRPPRGRRPGPGTGGPPPP